MDSTYKKVDLKLILAIVATGLMSFSGVVVETAMNVTFPTLMRQFQIGTSAVQWITTGYLLVLAVIIPASSFLKKRFTTKALFITADLLFIAGTILAAFTPDFTLLLMGRLIQGVGTGIALPLMFNIVLEQVPASKLGLMMGVASLITAAAPAVGPSLGGWIVTLFGWRMIFIALLPFLLLALVMGSACIRQVTVVERVRFDWLGYGLLAVSFASFIFAASLAGTNGWLSGSVAGCFVLSAATLVLFYKHSKKGAAPIIRLDIFTYKPFVFSVLALVLVQFICLGLSFLIPNYAQLAAGADPFAAGCLLLPGCILGALLAPLGGKLLDHFGAKKPILFGNCCILAAMLCYSVLAERLPLMMFMIFYVAFAAGQGFSVGNTMTNGLKQLPEVLNADGNAMINTLQQLAGAIGTSVVTTLVAAEQAKLPEDLALATMLGSQKAFILLCALAVLIIICSLGVFQSSAPKKKTARWRKNSQIVLDKRG